MATISNTPRPGYVWDSTDNVWYPIGTGPHTHADYITSGSAINPNIVDAKGDIIAATAADTVARLAVGANDTVLTADSSTATGLKWATPAAGGMTLISTTTLTGSSITLSSIPATYNNLELIIQNFLPATDNVVLKMRFNGDTGVNYNWEATTTSGGPFTFDYNAVTLGAVVTQDNATATGLFQMEIPNYANATTWKMGYYYGMTNDPTTPTTQYRAVNASFQYESISAISSITLFPASGNFTSGTVLLYGVK
jgi:hypothetical protein